MQQLSMFDLDLFWPQPIIGPVDPHGEVIQSHIHTVLELHLPKHRSASARIEIHPHEDGTWMWATGLQRPDGTGRSYRVGPKWGKFALRMEDAIYWGVRELRDAIANEGQSTWGTALSKWLSTIEPSGYAIHPARQPRCPDCRMPEGSKHQSWCPHKE